MRFTTKGGLKLDKSELKAIQKARDIVAGVAQHSSNIHHAAAADRLAESLEELLASLTPDRQTELPFEQAESSAT